MKQKNETFTKEQLQAGGIITMGFGGLIALLTVTLISGSNVTATHFEIWGAVSVFGLIYLIGISREILKDRQATKPAYGSPRAKR